MTLAEPRQHLEVTAERVGLPPENSRNNLRSVPAILNFAPRAGLAYQLAHNMVVHVSFGIFYNSRCNRTRTP